MSPYAITAYSDYLNDHELLNRHTGILCNFLESCARQISESYKHTPIPRTSFTGINVDFTAIANPYISTSKQNQITVGLSISNSQFEQDTRSSFSLYVTLEVRVYMPNPPLSRNNEEPFTSETQWRDLRNVLAVIDGLYVALIEIPYYHDGVWSGQYIPMTSMQQSYAITPVISCQYRIPVLLKRRTDKIESILLNTSADEGHAKWTVNEEFNPYES